MRARIVVASRSTCAVAIGEAIARGLSSTGEVQAEVAVLQDPGGLPTTDGAELLVVGVADPGWQRLTRESDALCAVRFEVRLPTSPARAPSDGAQQFWESEGGAPREGELERAEAWGAGLRDACLAAGPQAGSTSSTVTMALSLDHRTSTSWSRVP